MTTEQLSLPSFHHPLGYYIGHSYTNEAGFSVRDDIESLCKQLTFDYLLYLSQLILTRARRVKPIRSIEELFCAPDIIVQQVAPTVEEPSIWKNIRNCPSAIEMVYVKSEEFTSQDQIKLVRWLLEASA